MSLLLNKTETEPTNISNKVILYSNKFKDENNNSSDLVTSAKVAINKSTDYTFVADDFSGQKIFYVDVSITESISFTLPNITSSGQTIEIFTNNNNATIHCHSSDFFNGQTLKNIYLLPYEYVQLISNSNTNTWTFFKSINVYKLFNIFNNILSGYVQTSVSYIDTQGMVWSWGNNASGQLGDNTLTSRSTPVRVCGDITFCKISISTHVLGIDNTGMAWGWGTNTGGQLGNNSTTNKSTPVRVCGDITFCQIFVGYTHSIGIDYQGMAWGWGTNNFGSLGDNTVTCRSTPVRVCGDITFCQISAGGSNDSIGIDYQGMAWGWGRNAYGEIGDNTVVSKNTPVRVCGDITFCQIYISNGLCLGLDYQGMAWGWGNNSYGGLGDNSISSKSTPVRVCGDITFCQLYAGNYHSLGLDYQGMAWAWGYNNQGQIGNNSITSKQTPVRVCGDITFCQISAGISLSFGYSSGNIIWGWGYNNNRLISNYNTSVSIFTPIKYFF